jgi:hypothetical protein
MVTSTASGRGKQRGPATKSWYGLALVGLAFLAIWPLVSLRLLAKDRTSTASGLDAALRSGFVQNTYNYRNILQVKTNGDEGKGQPTPSGAPLTAGTLPQVPVDVPAPSPSTSPIPASEIALKQLKEIVDGAHDSLQSVNGAEKPLSLTMVTGVFSARRNADGTSAALSDNQIQVSLTTRLVLDFPLCLNCNVESW